MMTKEAMMDKVMRRRGFEDEKTIFFCKVAEHIPNDKIAMEYLYNLMEQILNYPLCDENE